MIHILEFSLIRTCFGIVQPIFTFSSNNQSIRIMYNFVASHILVKPIPHQNIEMKMENVNIQLRRVQLEDFKAVQSLLKQLTVCDDLNDEQIHQFYELSKCPTHLVHVLELNGEVIGCATLLIEQKLIRGFKKVGHIEDVVIDEKFRLNGFGKYMITQLIQKGREAGCYKVILDCDKGNVGFYDKCNMKQKGVEMAYYFE
uniref:Glucosamine 6-phosphate N-acetyltransferase n=1 Tax=Trepomonas sp. PC1 TaxID=1076344 RepID=A0A146KFT7_9EUKA|eukprot:JAP94754.1 Glucose 6-phosphate N-acetyltransferase [Trepomonas sp. PC1]